MIFGYKLLFKLSFIVICLLLNNFSSAYASNSLVDSDFEFYKKTKDHKLSNNTDFELSQSSETLLSDDYISKKQLFEDFQTVDLKDNVSTYQLSNDVDTSSYSYSSNILQNGNFELGHTGWQELYLNSAGNWVDYDFIISAGSGGYNSWYAYLTDFDWLISNSSQVPSNTVDFRISYAYRLVYFGSCDYAYGTNGVGVYITDTDRNVTYVVNAHDAELDAWDYNYVQTSFLASTVANISQIGSHDVYIDFLHINDDPNCSIAFYLDNVSVEPVLYVADYQISTTSGSNGSITTSQTVSSGSSLTVNITPNSGYQIADVQIDGVSVGPINYYTFSNIDSSHTVYATFEGLVTTSKRVYRFWSDQNQAHFYTTHDDELTLIVNSYDPYVWRYESVAYRAFGTQTQGTVPLYRFWSDQNQAHFYTAFEDEKNLIIATYPEYVWRYEGIAYYVFPSGTSVASSPIYRFWSDQNQAHFYTAFEDEKNLIIATYPEFVWRYEGIAFKAPN